MPRVWVRDRRVKGGGYYRTVRGGSRQTIGGPNQPRRARALRHSVATSPMRSGVVRTQNRRGRLPSNKGITGGNPSRFAAQPNSGPEPASAAETLRRLQRERKALKRQIRRKKRAAQSKGSVKQSNSRTVKQSGGSAAKSQARAPSSRKTTAKRALSAEQRAKKNARARARRARKKG